MLCPFCMLDYTAEAPCFCHTAVGASEPVKASRTITLDVVAPRGDFNLALLVHLDVTAVAAPYLGA